MQVTETLSEGLKRELKITVPASELDRRLTERLEEIKGEVQLKGFRPGKVPLAHLRRTFGKRVMPEVVERIVQETTRKALDEREERPALQPQISFAESEPEIDNVMAGQSDLAFTMAFEVIPSIEPIEFSAITLKRPVAEVSDADVDEALERIRAEHRRFEPRPEAAKAKTGDRLTIDFVGRIDGEAFEGGAAEGAQLELGAGGFIPGFAEQLEGVKAGEEKDISVTFPEDYGAAHLAGKDAVFSVTVREVAEPIEATLDDEMAKSLGLESLDKLKEAVRKQIEGEYARGSRERLKRRLLDELDSRCAFDLPPSLVDSEFESIWRNVLGDLERAGRTFEDEGTTEDEAREEYRGIASRRVRLGLLLADVGEKNGITVPDDDLNRAVLERARQFRGQEAQALKFLRENPQALAEIRAPLFEDKVVDFILELAEVEDEAVSRAQLFSDEEHDHSHDHDGHGGEAKDNKKKKRSSKPKSAGKRQAKSAD